MDDSLRAFQGPLSWVECLTSDSLVDSLALGVVVTDLVQEEFLDGVELLGPLEHHCRETQVPAQSQAHCRAHHRGELEQPVKSHLEDDKERNSDL